MHAISALTKVSPRQSASCFIVGDFKCLPRQNIINCSAASHQSCSWLSCVHVDINTPFPTTSDPRGPFPPSDEVSSKTFCCKLGACVHCRLRAQPADIVLHSAIILQVFRKRAGCCGECSGSLASRLRLWSRACAIARVDMGTDSQLHVVA